jgi:hypothetical protein
MVIGAPTAKGDRGVVYVIFGAEKLKKKIDLGASGNYDVMVTGPEELGRTGAAVAVGDVNGDKFGDIIISSPDATFPNGSQEWQWRDQCGLVHIIYGNSSMKILPKLKNPDDYDVKILGEQLEDFIGGSLGSGDINGDGIDDIIIGSPNKKAGYPDRFKAGEVDVIFGNPYLPKLWDLRYYANKTAASKGIVNANLSIIGAQRYDQIGFSLEIADLNNDKYDDIIIGVPFSTGKTGAKTESGEVYIIYGDKEENLIKNSLTFIDAINMTRDGFIIYGKDSGDNFGYSIAAGDVDGDDIKDILVGAPGARGINDDSDRTGESYIFHGSNEKEHGELEIETIVDTSGLPTFYGKMKGEQSGYIVLTGDLDKNGRDDIIISAPDSDDLNGSTSGVGRIDILFEYKVKPRITHTSFEVIGGGGENGTICYAGEVYSFRIKVFNSLGAKNLNFTQLSLEPSELNIQFRWSRENNTFYEVSGSDKKDNAELNSEASVSRKINDTIYELDFGIIFNFNYPSQQLSSCQVYSLGYNLSVPAAINRYQDIYYVENNLDLIGNLVVTGSSQGELKDGDRVHSNETIVWSGLKVVYNGTTDIYPNDKYFDVVVWDDDGDFWFDGDSSGKEIQIETKTDSADDPSDVHLINITNIPKNGLGLTEFEFELNIVTTKINFYDPKPEQTIWQKSKSITCGITISDDADWRIDGDSIEYSISTEGPFANEFGSWVNADESGLQLSFTPSVTVDFLNGEDNYIRWRVKNEVSDIYSGSEPFQINVDVEPVEYQSPVPIESNWQIDVLVECKITVFDNLTSVESDSIEYRTSTSGITGYGQWTDEDIDITKKDLVTSFGKNVEAYLCKVNIEFESGEKNFIQWRAEDIMGNSQKFSGNYRIRITSDFPVSTLDSPENTLKIGNLPLQLRWHGEDPNNDAIFYDIYLSDDYLEIEELDSSVQIVENYKQTQINVSELINGEEYFWTVIPNDGEHTGVCQSKIWSFIISLAEPISHLILPINNSILYNTNVQFLWYTEYYGVEEIKYDLYLGTNDPPIEKLAENLDTNSFRYNSLVEGNTYYWYVEPKVNTESGIIRGKSQPTIGEFSVDTDFSIPKVILKSPKNNTFLPENKPTLKWSLKNKDYDVNDIYYILFLDTEPIPTQILEQQIIGTNFTITTEGQLEFNKTYYWRILPINDSNDRPIIGELSEIWSFHTIEIMPEFNIDLNLKNNRMTLHPGDKKDMTFTITNFGELDDIINIEVINLDLSEIKIEIDKVRFELSSNEEGSGILTISAPKDIELGAYDFVIKATSKTSANYGIKMISEESLLIAVSKPVESDNLGLLLGTIIIILILIIILSYVFISKLKRKSKSAEKEDSDLKEQKKEPKKELKQKPIQKHKTKSSKTKKLAMQKNNKNKKQK